MRVRPLRGAGQAVLYLDFDGVLHPEDVWWHPTRGAYIKSPPGHQLFENAPLLVEVLEPYPLLRIVLSTSWVRRYSFSKAAARLPAPLRERVIGATFHSAMDDTSFNEAPRGMQIWADVLRRRPSVWLALDDDGLHWPAWCRDRWIRTHEVDGIRDPAVHQRLVDELARLAP